MALLAFAFSVMLRYPKNSKNGSFVRVNPQSEMKMTHSSTTIITFKAGHLLSEPGFDPHSTPQFRDLSSNFAKQNSTP